MIPQNMYYLLAVSYFLLLSSTLNLIVKSYDLQNIKDDLTKFNTSCAEENCEEYEEDSFSSRACHCGVQCVQLGTCCYDSSYANLPHPKLRPACRSVHNSNSYFIVDKCFSNDSVWSYHCEDEDIDDEDIQKIVPVTSLVTSITYKNYYCFRCHETSDEFLYWNLKVQSKYTLYTKSENSTEIDDDISFIYNKNKDAVMVSYGDNDSYWYFNVEASLEIPSEIENFTYICVPNVISDCPDDWIDEEVRDKCETYTALRVVSDGWERVPYKNIHCALCNNKSLDDIQCRRISYGTYGNRWRPGGGYGSHRRRPGGGGGYNRFTFTYLLDINRSDGELVGKIQRCSEDHKWDPFAKKCRKLTCALPGLKIKDGKCVEEES